ncbi:MAG: putative bifunctional diguanylate cyclase/phosphodiesterase [Yoonia sp.]
MGALWTVVKKFSTGLQAKTAVLLVVCALIPMTLGALVVRNLSETALRAEVAEKLDRAVTVHQTDLASYLESTVNDLVVFSQIDVAQDVLIGDVNGAILQSLGQFNAQKQIFSAIAVFDDLGTVVAISGPQVQVGMLVDDPERVRAFVQGAKHPRGYGTSGNWADDQMVVSVPIYADYDPTVKIGVVSGVIDIMRLSVRLNGLQVGGAKQDRQHLLVVTDNAGRVVFETPLDDGGPSAATILNWEKNHSSTQETHDNQHYMLSTKNAGSAPLTDVFGLQVFALVSEAEALSDVYVLQRNLLMTSGIVAFILIVCTLIAVNRVVLRPNFRLATAMNEFQLEQPLPADLVARTDELGQLTRAFKGLMQQLSDARCELITQSEAEIAKRSAHLDAALNNMSQGLCLYDEDHRLVVINERFYEIFGLDPEHLPVGTLLDDVIRKLHEEGLYTSDDVEVLISTIKKKSATGKAYSSLQIIPGHRTISISRVPIPFGGWVVTYSDISDQRRAQEKMEFMANHDSLTNLPNRLMFNATLEAALAVGDQSNIALLYLDLDHFKPVNDTLGHPIGDKLLKAVAARLKNGVRDGDVVARLGGDEFAIVLVDREEVDTPAKTAERLIEILCQPYQIDDHQIVIGSSIGIALAPQDGTTSEQLQKAADLALYRAKDDGRGNYRFFETGMDARMLARRALEVDLRAAVVNGDFSVNYQPIVALETGRITCFEALVRWHHPERGIIQPDSFISVAEDIGVINQIGALVLRQSCLEAVRWPEEIGVAVNLSPMQFTGMDLVKEVGDALSDAKLDPQRLTLEITESMLLNNTEATIQILTQLRARGVRIAMDDFGTGYSSLSYLRKFPFDKIKIDKSFIDDLGESADSQAIVRAIAALGTTLGMNTIMEGVETLDQLEAVRSSGCDSVQGYLYNRPAAADELASIIEKLHTIKRLAYPEILRVVGQE